MGLFSQDQLEQINAVAAKSKEVLKPIQVSKSVTSTQHEIDESTRSVLEYFGDSPAILITTVEELHDYITKVIESGYCAIDTETTGLDRIHDTVVGCSLYYPGGVECYIPNKHIVPIFETPYKNQLTYEEVGQELRRLVITDVKTIWYNADFDIAMTYKDYKVDFIPTFYYDAMIAWRCLKENESVHGLKALYAKYVQKGQGDPKKFTDFFSVKLFPYCKPEVAKLYAANDAKITFDLFKWQLPYVTKSHPKCQKYHLEKIADLVWNIEFPMVRICALMHRTGVYLDIDTSNVLKPRYHNKRDKEFDTLSNMIKDVMDTADATVLRKCPFKSAKDFNPNSPPQVSYLLRNIMGLELESTEKEVLAKLNIPLVTQLLKVRSIDTILGSFVDKLPETTGPTGRVHSSFNSIGAATGRMCIAKGTKITCLNGAKNIEDIVPGDLVYCYDATGEWGTKPVKNLWLTGQNKECVQVSWRDDMTEHSDSLICTPEHLILRNNIWVRADCLTTGDLLVSKDYDLPKVNVVKSAGKYDVYDIEVEDIHNFIANEICVHNSSSEPNVQNIPSHALDVRHQFRATPAMEKIDACDETENGIEVTLGTYDTVYMSDGSEKDVIDLQIGDEVILLDDDKEVNAVVKSISHQAPNTSLCFDVK